MSDPQTLLTDFLNGRSSRNERLQSRDPPPAGKLNTDFFALPGTMMLDDITEV